MGTAEQMYASDNQGYSVPNLIVVGGASYQGWQSNESFLRILGVSHNPNPSYFSYWNAAFLCPEAILSLNEVSTVRKGVYANARWAYGRNNEFGPSWADPGARCIKLGRLKSPSGKLLVMDANDTRAEYEKANPGLWQLYGENKPNENGTPNCMPLYRHGNKLNSAFYDGRVRAGISWNEVFDSAQSTRPANPQSSRAYYKYWNLWANAQ